jgi:hypothetical protein
MYYMGEGVDKDFNKAAEWSRKAAEQGDVNAQNNLGTIFAEGVTGPVNWTEALVWYRKAAAQGNAPAMNSIGAAYRDGKGGVSKSRKQAIKWFRKAAAGGEEKGIKNLGDIGVKYKGAPDPDGKVRKPSFIRSIACIIAGLIGAAIGAGVVSWLLGRIPFVGPLAVIAGALFCGTVGFYMFEESETKRALKGTMGIVLALSALIGISAGGKDIIAKLLPIVTKTAATQTAVVTATVTSDALNVRQGPSADTAVVTQLKKGDTLTVTEDTGGNWVKVEAGDATGYVRRDYITTGAAGE